MLEKWCEECCRSFSGGHFAREVQGMRVLYFCTRDCHSRWLGKNRGYKPRPVIWAPK